VFFFFFFFGEVKTEVCILGLVEDSIHSICTNKNATKSSCQEFTMGTTHTRTPLQ